MSGEGERGHLRRGWWRERLPSSAVKDPPWRWLEGQQQCRGVQEDHGLPQASLGQASQVTFGSYRAGTRQLVISCAKTSQAKFFFSLFPFWKKHGQRQLYQQDYTRRKVFSMLLPEKKGAAPILSQAGEAEPPLAAPRVRRAQLRLLPRASSSALRAQAPLCKVHKTLQSLY